MRNTITFLKEQFLLTYSVGPTSGDLEISKLLCDWSKTQEDFGERFNSDIFGHRRLSKTIEILPRQIAKVLGELHVTYTDVCQKKIAQTGQLESFLDQIAVKISYLKLFKTFKLKGDSHYRRQFTDQFRSVSLMKGTLNGHMELIMKIS